MRWVTFMLVVVALLTVQSTVAPRLSLIGARPDWLLVAVVVLALHAPARDAAIGAWIIGACADLMTIERFGLIALTYLLVAMIVTSVREFLFRHRWRTQVIVTLAVCLLVRSAWLVYFHLVYAPAGSVLGDWLIEVLLVSIYTAAWTPLFNRGFLRMARALGVAMPRYTYAGLHRVGGTRV